MARCGGKWVSKLVQWTLVTAVVLAATISARAQAADELLAG
jgi:hypothetical protein